MDKDMKILFDALIESLIEMKRLQEQLSDALTGKQKAMRSGDMDSLESWSAREKFLIDKVSDVERVSRRLASELGKKQGLSAEIGLTQLAERFSEPNRSRLLALVGAIRTIAERVRQMNRINDEVTREILCCFADIQRQMSAVHCDTGLYDTTGRKKVGIPHGFLDAVG